MIPAAAAIPDRPAILSAARGEQEGDMSATLPPDDTPAGPVGDPQPSPARSATARRGPSSRVRPTADFELMLALRGAARARDLRNRVVRPRSAETADATGPVRAPDDPADRPRDLAHPN